MVQANIPALPEPWSGVTPGCWFGVDCGMGFTLDVGITSVKHPPGDSLQLPIGAERAGRAL